MGQMEDKVKEISEKLTRRWMLASPPLKIKGLIKESKFN